MIELSKIKKKSILVIGDVMLDNYYVGDIKRISPEAPVPVFRKRTERSVLGGAANVAANLVAANQKVTMMSIIGNDDNGRKLLEYFKEKGINTDLVQILDRNTTIKTRFLAGNNHNSNLDGYIYGQSVRGADEEFKNWVLDQKDYVSTQ